MQGGACRGLVGTEDADDALLAVRRASSQWREGGGGRSPAMEI